MIITRGFTKDDEIRDEEGMNRIVDKVIENINKKIEEKGWDHRKLAEHLERLGDKDLSEADEEKRIKRNEVWLSRKIGKKVKATRRLTVDDLHIIAKGLDAFPSDFFPKRLEEEICSLPLTDFIRNVCRNEIKHYLKENGIKI